MGFATESGGGLAILNGPISVMNALFDGNSTVDFGGGISVNSGDDFTLQDAEIINNSADFGGGLGLLSTAAVVVDGVPFSNNTAVTRGGAIYGGQNATTVSIANCSFTANSATSIGADGGAIGRVGSLAPTYVDSCNFDDNTSTDAGGAIYTEGPLDTRNSSFWSNDSGGDGGAIFAQTQPDSPQILSSSFYDNSAGGAGGGIALVLGTAATSGIVRNTAMWANGGDISGTSLATITYTCSQQLLSMGTGNQIAPTDPFVLGPSNELFLDQSSVCVDNGNDPAATTDYADLGLDWQMLTTASDSTLDASPVDMGVHYSP